MHLVFLAVILTVTKDASYPSLLQRIVFRQTRLFVGSDDQRPVVLFENFFSGLGTDAGAATVAVCRITSKSLQQMVSP